MLGKNNFLRRFLGLVLAVFFIGFELQALRIETRYINQNDFRGPCGCIALVLAGRLSGRESEIAREIASARKIGKKKIGKNKKRQNLLSTDVLARLAKKAGFEIHCLELKNSKPHLLGYIEWIEPVSEVQARFKKLHDILGNFKHSNERYLHFLCHLLCDKEDHGFLISIDRVKDTMYVHTDCVTASNHSGIEKYATVLGGWYAQV